MRKIIYTFPLTDNESIEMQLIGIYQNSIENIFYTSFVHVFFNQSNVYTLLTYDTLNDVCVLLNFFCKKTLKGDYFIDKKYLPDVSMVYNENFYKAMRSKSEEKESHNLLKCINRFILWSTILSKNNMKAWMYNDADGQIILFIAPVYPFTFTSKRVKGYVPYEQWIKTYRPFAKRIISPTIAQEWIKQTDQIMALIQKNSESNSKNSMHSDVGRPKNGQKALDNSIAFKQTYSVRISASDNQFVILTKTKGNVSHGHVALWNELELAMQDALVDEGLVTQYGKIICKN